MAQTPKRRKEKREGGGERQRESAKEMEIAPTDMVPPDRERETDREREVDGTDADSE
ncbi:hypothetical protein NHX12_004960, partial [Muraenolepis orangiensis]